MTSPVATDAPAAGRSPDGRPPLRVAVVATLVLALLVAACTGSGAEDASDDGPGSDSSSSSSSSSSTVRSRDLRLPTIRLGVMPWTGAEVNVAIAEQVIERRLGYPVEAVPVTDMGRMLTELEAGDLDAVLELWPSGLLEEEQQRIDDGPYLDLGPLGVEGQIGWYVPRYVTTGEPPVTDWEDLADPVVARTFATPATGRRGRLLGTDPGYEQYDEELIDALDLDLVVEYSGSDAATATEVAAAVAAGEPILLYWWTPTALVARFDLVEVELPPHTTDCAAEIEAGATARCGYPSDELFKIGSPDLTERAPDVDHVLREFRLGTEEQLALIDRIDNGGESVDEVAAAWISANKDRWESWLP